MKLKLLQFRNICGLDGANVQSLGVLYLTAQCWVILHCVVTAKRQEAAVLGEGGRSPSVDLSGSSLHIGLREFLGADGHKIIHEGHSGRRPLVIRGLQHCSGWGIVGPHSHTVLLHPNILS